MIDVSEIDLDKLTTLELWELHERVAARLGSWESFDDGLGGGYDTCPAITCGFNTHAAVDRMKALL